MASITRFLYVLICVSLFAEILASRNKVRVKSNAVNSAKRYARQTAASNARIAADLAIDARDDEESRRELKYRLLYRNAGRFLRTRLEGGAPAGKHLPPLYVSHDTILPVIYCRAH